jgi:hypothetical protein
MARCDMSLQVVHIHKHTFFTEGVLSLVTLCVVSRRRRLSVELQWNYYLFHHFYFLIVQVLGKLPGQEVLDPSAMITYPLGIGDTLQIVCGELGSLIVQVLGKLPGQEVLDPSDVITYPLGIGDTLQIVCGELGCLIVQVLGKLPGQEMLDPSAMITYPLGIDDDLQIVVLIMPTDS